MITLIKTEFLKLRRSYMIFTCAAGALCAPLLMLLVFLSGPKKIEFLNYMEQTNMIITILIGTLLYGLLATYMFEREFTDDMLKHLFTVPVSKFKFLLSKVIVIAIGMFLLTLLSYSTGLIMSIFAGFENINFDTISTTLILFLKGYMAFIPLMLPVIFVTLLFKGFVAPIAFSIVVEITLFIIIQSKYLLIFPWSAPMIHGTTLVHMSADSILFYEKGMYLNIASNISVGIVFFVLCLLFLEKKEVA